jgi:hypothetical protein
MADIFIEREHNLGLDRALTRSRPLPICSSRARCRMRWCGNRLDFTRAGASGSVEVTETLLDPRGASRIPAQALQRRIEQNITDKLDSLVPCDPSA